MKKIFMLVLIISILLFGCLNLEGNKKENLIITEEIIKNGDFSNQTSNWEKIGYRMGSKEKYDSGIEIKNSYPKQKSIKLNGVNGSNYYIMLQQKIELDTNHSNYFISFDWKVDKMEGSYGYSAISFYFLDEEEKVLGTFVSHASSDERHTKEYLQGSIPNDQYKLNLEQNDIFDWDNVYFETKNLNGIDHSKVKTVKVIITQSNDAGYGGISFFDNISILGESN